jgi:hypothetical protein
MNECLVCHKDLGEYPIAFRFIKCEGITGILNGWEYICPDCALKELSKEPK